MRKALQPAGTPVGPITKERPNRSVLMLGSAAVSLSASTRFGLKVEPGGAAARDELKPTPSMTTPFPGLATTTLTTPVRGVVKAPTGRSTRQWVAEAVRENVPM